MSRLWLITCDRCGAESQPHERRQECLNRAAKQGWHLRAPQHGRMNDICPECWGKPPPKINMVAAYPVEG